MLFNNDVSHHSYPDRNPTFKQLIDKINRELKLKQNKKSKRVKLIKREIAEILNTATIQTDDDLIIN